ncbi:16S rRNA (guanine(966)-N(2))-methyltransferase RsmD [Jezberella montanilacus]|jgi:16S rRNA (guanine(966)-N(2))-methyltransferase RsmD|uniref:16S rRNA (Guanine(966)-N(2))-methyltransferase RsmD n=1 Tax=Jezberella montanilacus TaxID=323426 RepID=A0A2T0XG83_9BURK|nr:16S rRNA (guanine(966)-N(2))-methyltransferase RsmD [Jezberella montanilacus]PRY97927.1 16S rRNA (guanine(966)-N(2))-methyltransferase RsmD [Jezberella montanilacus]
MGKKYIRIVAGQYRRAQIEVIEATGLRPTPDRVRETLFNWLTHFWGGEFDDKQVLDLFAGSGALGFEAASRGVRQVQIVEQDRQALAALRTLKTKLNATQVDIYAGDALAYVQKATHPDFDLVLLDPPFSGEWLEKLWPQLPKLLATDALVYVESGKPLEIPDNFKILRQDRAGVVHYSLIQFVALQK